MSRLKFTRFAKARVVSGLTLALALLLTVVGVTRADPNAPNYTTWYSVNNVLFTYPGNRVGIGTSAPAAPLEVSQSNAGQVGGNVRISNPAGGRGTQSALDFSTYNISGVAPGARMLATDDGAYSAALDLQVKAPGAPANGLVSRLHINPDGKVGIGTTNPTASGLHISAYGSYGWPQIKATQTLQGDFSRLRLESGTFWDVAAAGNTDEMHLFASSSGKDVLRLQANGNVSVAGNLSKAGGSFKIDHPLDPANKYLSHSFVESPDMLNIYNGNVVTDKNGDATVALPDYFQALNRDYRYQLTVIGQFAQAIVSSEMKDNHFSIKTDKPGVKVSWQVTGIRQDVWANAHRIPTEEDKTATEKGLYLHPELFGQPENKSIEWAQNPDQMKVLQTAKEQAQAKP